MAGRAHQGLLKHKLIAVKYILHMLKHVVEVMDEPGIEVAATDERPGSHLHISKLWQNLRVGINLTEYK